MKQTTPDNIKKIETIDIEPTWSELCQMGERGRIKNWSILMPACALADQIRQAQKAGKRSITFQLVGDLLVTTED